MKVKTNTVLSMTITINIDKKTWDRFAMSPLLNFLVFARVCSALRYQSADI